MRGLELILKGRAGFSLLRKFCRHSLEQGGAVALLCRLGFHHFQLLGRLPSGDFESVRQFALASGLSAQLSIAWQRAESGIFQPAYWADTS